MPFFIVEGDITKLKVDAIVNAANNSLLGGGGVDGCIHRAAGPQLLDECATLNGCPTGEAKITGAYLLPCRHVIHTVGPIWEGGDRGEEALLISCYRRSLQLAVENHCSSVAFPLISAGVYGYPKDEALKVASATIVEFLQEHDLDVYLVIFSRRDYCISPEIIAVLDEWTELYQRPVTDVNTGSRLFELLSRRRLAPGPVSEAPSLGKSATSNKFSTRCSASCEATSVEMPADLALQLENLDETFTAMLLRKIDEKGIGDVQCYKKANLDRKLFSRIRSDYDYRPSKPTVFALAIALELTMRETEELLTKAGFAFSRSNRFDVIVAYFIMNETYDIYTVNQALFHYGQRLLGSR